VLGFLWLITLVTFLDRVNIAIAGVPIAKQFGFSAVQLGTVFSAFVLGYTLCQLPGGWLGDRFGHKRILAFALIWWSTFTAITALAGKAFISPILGVLPAFWVVRFSIGIGEAATYPCANGLIARWFGVRERALAAGIMLAGNGVGSATAPPLIGWLMVRFGWEVPFYVCGGIGILLALCFVHYVPEKEVNDREKDPFRWGISRTGPAPTWTRKGLGFDGKDRTPWQQLLTNSQLWLLTTSLFFVGYVVYVYFSWFYAYLVEVRGFSLLRGSFLTTLPFLAMALSAPAGGWASDRMIARMGRVGARRLVACGGLAGAGLLIIMGSSAHNVYWAIVCLSLAAGSVYLSMGCYFATATEILPGRTATVSGIMNTGTNLGGVVAPVLTPWVAARFGWTSALWLTAGCSAVAAIMWSLIGVKDAEIIEPVQQPGIDQ